jgi:hypothetical protein
VGTPQDRLLAAAARLSDLFASAGAAVTAPTDSAVTVSGDVAATVCAWSDTILVESLAVLADARRAVELLGATISAEVERRSGRERGYDGLAQRSGHRTAIDLVQAHTGQTRADVRRATRVGADLRAVEHIGSPSVGVADPPWYLPLTDALSEGRLSPEQYDAIRHGLGDPCATTIDASTAVVLWREAASMLIVEAFDRPVEDLRAAARLARDTLDPEGTLLRFEESFARRSFRMFVDRDGQHHARLVFDDDAAAWVRTILAAALRPRRGPRFVDPDAPPGEPTESDDRTNEQLQYDTLLGVLRTGAAADPMAAFGDRQPGVRIVTTVEQLERRDTDERPGGVAWIEETGQAIPSALAHKYLCDAGTVRVVRDAADSPLDVGRDQRLFTRKQRDVLAIRDGGCLWCGAEPSRCEAHHIDHWHEHHGRTDVADGVLLCRNCHMRLHNQGWRIRRTGGEYWLHPPDRGDPRQLHPRSLLRFARAG